MTTSEWTKVRDAIVTASTKDNIPDTLYWLNLCISRLVSGYAVYIRNDAPDFPMQTYLQIIITNWGRSTTGHKSDVRIRARNEIRFLGRTRLQQLRSRLWDKFTELSPTSKDTTNADAS